MANKNTYILTEAGHLENPITFASTTGQSVSVALVTARANVDLFLDLIATEGAEQSDHRLFLDQMTPQARSSVYAILLGLKDSLAD